MAHRLVKLSMTSRDYDVILVKSHTQSRRTRNLGPGPTIHVDPLSKHTIVKRKTLCLKISSFGLELWEKKHLV